ncbi:hypothetical protein M9Y10_001307 [Tritrichomonas musculus]|uniref:Initiator binding domain-containing protein n=1 Tax=Tritrichomonas musculus TaxID=1915356 RepID=A0ABR2L7N4_9EUKA
MDTAHQSSRGADFSPHPVFWDRLTADDKAEFFRLRNQLHSYQKPTGKDPRVVTFRKELLSVLQFTERDEAHREERCILTGIAFAGPLICVNTRLLKSFLGRCKSSINGGFQQMGYVAIRTKGKARTCIVTVMRSLTSDPALLRQWTVRGASPHAESCFVSSFNVSLLPEITQSDLNIDNRSMSRSSSFFIQKPEPLFQGSSILSSVSTVISTSTSSHQEIQKPEQFGENQFNFSTSNEFGRFDDIDMSVNWNFNQKDEITNYDLLDEPRWDNLSDFSMTRSMSTINLDNDLIRSSNDWAAL